MGKCLVFVAPSPLRAATLVLALAALPVANSQPTAGVALGELEGTAVLNALAQECYEAGLESDMPNESIMDCTGVLEERSTGPDDGGVVVRHKVRFMLLDGGEGKRIAADAWTEIDELGTTIEEPLASEDYSRRVQGVLQAVVARLRSSRAPQWAGRYESAQAWHLDAHLRGVRYCDANLASMTAESVAAQLESIGLRPLDDDLRDRCEQLYTHVFEWGLARGLENPTFQEYVEHRASLPAEQRTCSGQLAREASCRR